jgi:hypothetical protein
MLSLILSLWFAQSVPALPQQTTPALEPVQTHAAECCCGEKCAAETCQRSKSEDKACCSDGHKCCTPSDKADAKESCCAAMQDHVCCADSDKDEKSKDGAPKCCGGTHCQRHSKAGS